MVKNKNYFLRLAIVKTVFAISMCLIAPIFVGWYMKQVPEGYIGYPIFGSIMSIIMTVILVGQAWVLALDKNARKDYLKED